MNEMVKMELTKWLDAGIVYAISNNEWVSLTQCVPKKVPTRTVTRWRVCIDYKKLNDTTRKDHFPLPFIG
ncbi:RNA-directed DNA polymerase-like protein [Gossypium australe]|uniref:RNA-directed DNA polymerase-like protein n=1 Tax=Gossypium australe TaxID=47621 RepID=A0A5B6X1E1_9ROSI|nr:RNA-directed DNA polymerase-like protein [Gossypium australe]